MALRPAQGSVFPELVLLVDRDTTARRSYAETLTTFGFRLETAGDAQEAFNKSLVCGPDVIASIHDPDGVDALALGRRLKQDPRTRDIPYILVGAVDKARTGFESAVDSTLTAPCLPETLGAEIRRLLLAAREVRLRLLGVQLTTARGRTMPGTGWHPPDDVSSERANTIRDRVSARFRTFLKVDTSRCPSCGHVSDAHTTLAACPHCGRPVARRG